MVSCGSTRVIDPLAQGDSYFVIKGVPFVKQEYQYCGPAALTTVLSFYGENINQHEVARHVYTSELQGSLITDMRYYADSLGYSSRVETGDANTLKNYIERNIPVIVLVDRGIALVSVKHYYVVYGFGLKEDVFVIHDGKRRDIAIDADELNAEWSKMNRLMLIVEK